MPSPSDFCRQNAAAGMQAKPSKPELCLSWVGKNTCNGWAAFAFHVKHASIAGASCSQLGTEVIAGASTTSICRHAAVLPPPCTKYACNCKARHAAAPAVMHLGCLCSWCSETQNNFASLKAAHLHSAEEAAEPWAAAAISTSCSICLLLACSVGW